MPTKQSGNYLVRPPRIQPELPINEVEILPPPTFDNKSPPLWQSLLPVISILGYVLVSATGQGKNITFLIPMGLAIIASTGLTFYNTHKTAEEDRKKRQDYLQTLAELRREMVSAHEMQKSHYFYNYPDIDVSLTIDGDRHESRLGTRLWERRTHDSDFGFVRLGVGTRLSSVIYNVSASGNTDGDLFKDAQKLASDSQYISNVPITIPLYQPVVNEEDSAKVNFVARNSINLYGDSSLVAKVAQALAVNFTVFHSPSDTHLYVIGSKDASERWEWAKPLPHCRITAASHSLCFEEDLDAANNAKEIDNVRLFLKALRTELDKRENRLRDSESKVGVSLPFILLIVDLLTHTPGDNGFRSALDDLEADAAISKAFAQGKTLGISVIVLSSAKSKLAANSESLIEVEQSRNEAPQFRYSEIGVNTPRYVGTVDIIAKDKSIGIENLRSFSTNLSKWKVRQDYGSDIADGISLLDLNHASDISDLDIPELWTLSTEARNANWLRVLLGVTSGNEPRQLTFSADADGVHGLVAGSTGSGKSELLMMLIMGLAIRYDPSVVNFVLIDYKGGAAFDPFKDLPHCVEIVTSLKGNAVARMFTAIRAEIARRTEVITRTKSKHIVEYFKNNRHKDIQPFPHLFIMIDEFAQMIASNPEYKAQLEDITRLGRALGVYLILAAQRPSGVTDQMRSNIKFRISLRVETPEESKELLRRSDAAYLPNGIPGRGFLQIGNSIFEPIQVAFTGEDYVDWNVVVSFENADLEQLKASPVIWLNRQSKGSTSASKKLYQVLVTYMANLAKEISVPQRKPWPSFLPDYLSLNWGQMLEVEYIEKSDLSRIKQELPSPNSTITLNPALTAWAEASKRDWDGIDWDGGAMYVAAGLVDDPANARLLVLNIDLANQHYILFGSSGSGKTNFIRTVVSGLVCTHMPTELNIYILDFGNRNLTLFENLPHLGAYILPEEEERVQQFIRKMASIIDERKEILSDSDADNVYIYNDRFPENILPVILIVVDNFAAFKENFEDLIPHLMSLIREGISNGIHFLITADLLSAVPNGIFSLLSGRMTLKLADEDYLSIVGRGVKTIEEIPGRGYINIGKSPLEFQIATPIGVTPEERIQGIDETRKLSLLVDAINSAWTSSSTYKPQKIVPLTRTLHIEDVLRPSVEQGTQQLQIFVGRNADQQTVVIENLRQNPHFAIVGPSVSGRTTALHTIILSLARNYAPERLSMVLVDRQRGLFNYGGDYSLLNLPHVLETISESSEMTTIIEKLSKEFEDSAALKGKQKDIFLIIDNYDDFIEIVPKSNLRDLVQLARVHGRDGFHVFIAGSQDSLRIHELKEITRQVMSKRAGIALDIEAVESFSTRSPRGMVDSTVIPGRCLFIRGRNTSVVQIAAPYFDENSLAQNLDEFILSIQRQYSSQSTATSSTTHTESKRNNKKERSSTKPPADTEKQSSRKKQSPKESNEIQIQLLKNALKQKMGFMADAMRIDQQPLQNLIDLAIIQKIDVKSFGIEVKEKSHEA